MLKKPIIVSRINSCSFELSMKKFIVGWASISTKFSCTKNDDKVICANQKLHFFLVLVQEKWACIFLRNSDIGYTFHFLSEQINNNKMCCVTKIVNFPSLVEPSLANIDWKMRYCVWTFYYVNLAWPSLKNSLKPRVLPACIVSLIFNWMIPQTV